MSELTFIQIKLLKMLKSFHEFCLDNNLRYYAIGGSMLGIARHKGFIPWDDDIDIGMPRVDYEKFLKIVKNKPISNCVVESSDSLDPAFIYPFSKLYDTQSTLIENKRIPLKRGVYIDIFPIDGVGDTIKEAKKNFKKINKKTNIITIRSLAKDDNRSVYKKIVISLFQALPSIIIDEKRIIKEINTICNSRSFDSCLFVGNVVGAWGLKEIMPREYFGKPTLYEFENIFVMGVECYDDYLSHIYGNWKELPPIEKRISHHSYTVDFNRSYLE